MKKLILFVFIFSLFTMTVEAKKTKQNLPFAVKQSDKKHRTWKQKPVKHSRNFNFKNCLK